MTKPSQKRKKKQKYKTKQIPKTHNGKMILDVMLSQGLRGNYKDYVIVGPAGIMHWKGTFALTYKENGEKIELPAIALMHKQILSSVFGRETGDLFWRNGGRSLAKF